MGAEHAPETVWQAEELYCVDRLSFAAVAARLGVADSTLRRWAKTYDWRAKRDEIAKAQSGMRADSIKARARVMGKLLTVGGAGDTAQIAFAVAALERLELEKQKVLEARQAAALEGAAAQIGTQNEKSAPPELPALPDGISDDERLALLEQAVNKQLEFVLTQPVDDISRRVRDIKAAMDVIAGIRGKGTPEQALNIGFEE